MNTAEWVKNCQAATASQLAEFIAECDRLPGELLMKTKELQAVKNVADKLHQSKRKVVAQANQTELTLLKRELKLVHNELSTARAQILLKEKIIEDLMEVLLKGVTVMKTMVDAYVPIEPK